MVTPSRGRPVEIPELPPRAAAVGQALNHLHDRLEGHQTDYITRTGRYWQGIELELSLADVDLGRRPTDQPEDWGWARTFPFTRLESLVRVDVYEGPGGWGYVTTAKIPGDQGSWRKALAEGLEAERAITEWAWVEDEL